MKAIFYALFLSFLLISCKQSEVPAEEVAMAELPPKAARYYDGDEDRAVAAASALPAPPMPDSRIQQKIIRSATLKFQCDDLKQTNDRIIASVKKFGGYLQNDSESNDYSAVRRTLQLRVPSKNFDAFLAEVASGVNYFDEKNISSEDVTDEYIDNDSRIKTQKALEARYLELLKKANKVSEMLEIEQKLSEIREQIESKQARLNYLQTQVDMSLFSIEFYKNVPQGENASVSFGSKIWNALKTGVNGLLDFFVGLLEMWPFILILVALILFFRKRWRRRQKN